MELTFVVGTGRCGSTLLSRLLREHPDVLSMSEFFSTLRIAASSGPARFPTSDMDGAQLWRLLASPFPMLDAMISDGLRTSEMLYPRTGRFAPVDAAAKVADGTRVLITDGTADTNIPVSTINPLATALTGAGTTGPGLKLLTGVNHLLHMPGTQNNDPVLAPSVAAAIKTWAQPFATTG